MIDPQFLLLGFSILMIVIYIPGLLQTRKFAKSLKSFTSEKEVIRSTSISFLIISFLFLSVNWEFTQDWTITYSIIGWLLFIKGVVWLWSPEFVKKKAKSFLKHDNLLATASIAAILVGVGLSYIAINII